jgi:hypothetical protein
MTRVVRGQIAALAYLRRHAVSPFIPSSWIRATTSVSGSLRTLVFTKRWTKRLGLSLAMDCRMRWRSIFSSTNKIAFCSARPETAASGQSLFDGSGLWGLCVPIPLQARISQFPGDHVRMNATGAKHHTVHNVGCLPESGNQGHISERGITQFGSEFFNRSYPIADMRKVRRKNGANGRSNIEGKVARVATNERWAASEFQLGSNSANDERMTNGNVMLMLMIEGQHPTPINREQAWWNALSSTRWQ